MLAVVVVVALFGASWAVPVSRNSRATAQELLNSLAQLQQEEEEPGALLQQEELPQVLKNDEQAQEQSFLRKLKKLFHILRRHGSRYGHRYMNHAAPQVPNAYGGGEGGEGGQGAEVGQGGQGVEGGAEGDKVPAMVMSNQMNDYAQEQFFRHLLSLFGK